MPRASNPQPRRRDAGYARDEASRDGSAEVPGVAEGLVGLGDPDPDPDSVAGPGAPGFVGVGPGGALALGEVDEGDGAVALGAKRDVRRPGRAAGWGGSGS